MESLVFDVNVDVVLVRWDARNMGGGGSTALVKMTSFPPVSLLDFFGDWVGDAVVDFDVELDGDPGFEPTSPPTAGLLAACCAIKSLKGPNSTSAEPVFHIRV